MFEKRFLVSVAIVFTFIFLFDGYFHGILLADFYAQTASLWRSKEEVRQYFPFLLTGQLSTAFFFCLIFKEGFGGKGVLKGFLYGLLIFGLYIGNECIHFSVQPIPNGLFFFWMLGNFIEITLMGILLACISPRRAK